MPLPLVAGLTIGNTYIFPWRDDQLLQMCLSDILKWFINCRMFVGEESANNNLMCFKKGGNII